MESNICSDLVREGVGWWIFLFADASISLPSMSGKNLFDKSLSFISQLLKEENISLAKELCDVLGSNAKENCSFINNEPK